MATIFDLTLEQQQLEDALLWDEENEAKIDRLNKVRGHIEFKLSYLTDILAELTAEEATRETALKEGTKRLEKRYKQAKNAKERVKKFLLESMVNAGIEKIEGRFINVRSINHDKLILSDSFNIADLPRECYEVIPEVIKPINKEIMKAIKAGEVIEGAFVVNQPFLKEV